jgi:hypothetical protein
MEARIGRLELEMDGVLVRRFDAFDSGRERRAPDEARRRHLRLDRIDDIVGSELDAVAPEDPLTQLHGHLGEVVVVLPGPFGKLVVEGPVETGIGVDEPERIEHQLVQAVRPAATGTRNPDIEPRRIGRRLFRVVDDDGFVAREISDGRRGRFVLGECGAAEPDGRNQDRRQKRLPVSHRYPPCAGARWRLLRRCSEHLRKSS